jgi:hypothetical protein
MFYLRLSQAGTSGGRQGQRGGCGEEERKGEERRRRMWEERTLVHMSRQPEIQSAAS